MDARKMKKHILLSALKRHYEYMNEITSDPDYTIAIDLDLDEMKITQATIDRYYRVLSEMYDNAESKV